MSFLSDEKHATIKPSLPKVTASPEIVDLFDSSVEDIIDYFKNFNHPFINDNYQQITPLIISDKFTDKAFIGYDYKTGDKILSLRLNKSIVPVDRHEFLPLEFGRNVGTHH